MKLSILFAAIVLSGLMACSDEEIPEGYATMDNVTLTEPPSMRDEVAAPTMMAPPPPPPLGGAMEKKVIKKASFEWEVSNLENTKKQLTGICVSAGGYVGDQKQNEYGTRKEDSFTLYVPANKFDSVLNSFGQVEGLLARKEITAEDVTTEYIDVEARIRTQKELEIRLLELLQKGSKVSELMEIESKLAEVRNEIESMQGRMNYLKTRVAFSEITITIYKKVTTGIRFTDRLGDGVSDGWKKLQLGFIFVVSLWPWAILIVAGFAFWKLKRKKAGR